MSKLDELIAELCPDGVESKPLSEIATITRGGNLQKKDFTESGVPCIHYGQIYTKYGLFTDRTYTFVSESTASKQKKAVPGDIVMAVTSENIEDVCKCVVWLGDGDVAVSGHTAIIHHNQDAKYLAYYFHSSMFFSQKQKLAHGTKVIEVTPDKLNGVRVPVPPLEVQREIVRVLDNFTFLSAELSAELSARRKQYEYYRDELLHLDGERITIQELFDTRNGFTPSKDNPEFWNDGTLPWFKLDDINDKGRVLSESYLHITPKALKKSGLFPENSIIISTSATIGEYALITVPFLCNQRFTCMTVKPHYRSKVNIKYLMHYCPVLSKFCKEHLNQGNFASVDMKQFVKFEFVIPSIEEQNRIVSILDRFDTLCNDISSGLPAEIDARQKQYEYYRDKLLTFKEKVS